MTTSSKGSAASNEADAPASSLVSAQSNEQFDKEGSCTERAQLLKPASGGITSAKQAVNPYLPSWEYVPDGEPHVFGDRVYLFGSHDRFGGRKYCENDYVVWSAPLDDLSDWSSHGVAYRKEQDPANQDGKKALWAPDVAHGPDGRFYMYYCLAFQPQVSVAVADVPEGPYEFYGTIAYRDGRILGGSKRDVFPFDPAVLVDDDGRVYLYFGFAPEEPFLRWQIDRKGLLHEGAYVVELESDMRTVAVAPRLVVPMAGKSEGSGFEGHEYYEAASIRKIDGVYYFVYSSINGHELCYATSTEPDRDFQYGGVLISNGDIGYEGRTSEDPLNYPANNHGGLVEINGQWYIFYHRHTNRSQVSRQGLAEPIERNSDGGFVQAEMTSSGLNNSPLIGEGTYSAGIACVLRSATGARTVSYFRSPFDGRHPYITQPQPDRQAGSDQYIANMRHGAVAGFKYFDLTGTASLTIDARGGSGVMQVSTELNGAPFASLSIPASPGHQGTVQVPKGFGPHTALYFRFIGKGSTDFHTFTLSTSAV